MLHFVRSERRERPHTLHIRWATGSGLLKVIRMCFALLYKIRPVLEQMPTGTADHTLLSQHYLSQDTVSLSYHINRCNLHCKLTLLYRPLWSLSQPLILLGISVSSSVGHCPTLSQLVYPLDIFGILQCILNTKMMNEWNGNIFAPGESTTKTQTRLQWRGVGEIMTTTLILNPKTRNSVQ